MFRRIVFWSHLAAGVATGLVVLLMAATGVLLTYERQITASAVNRAIATPGAPLTAEALVAAAAANGARPGQSVVFPADPHAAVTVSTGRRVAFLLDPRTGAPVSDAAPGVKAFFGTVTELHRWLALTGEDRDTGRAITGAANLAFLFILVSGAVLWWPRAWRWRIVKNNLLFRRGLPNAKARDYNWHHVLGVWSVLPLAALVVSGVVISYPWASALVYTAYGETPAAGQGSGQGSGHGAGQSSGRGQAEHAEHAAPAAGQAPAAAPLPADALLAAARAAAPGANTVALRLPQPGAATIDLVADTGNGVQPDRQVVLTLSRADAAVIARRAGTDASPGQRARMFLRFLHTGEVYGIAGQSVAGLASAAACVLVWTGLALAWRRLVQPLLVRRMPG
jgi:uncharacterized iron-regulated membrane protein